ncbi:hypothetical protein EGW08_023844 [Elysia chlorotica]|uniref:Uncharacterized protein n=1 Tax=Elysia chlorotica TaxID=188477 RepID=A0A433SI76_ELYCH|nr:hypothetical protein EGW08_023844 [Elysia chlorotica]
MSACTFIVSTLILIFTQVLLEADPELISCQDRFGKSPLHCAVAAGSDELVRLLLEFGADANVRCHEGLTPLMYCCMADPGGSKVKVLQRLLEAGCLVDLTDYRGRRSAMHPVTLN